MTKYDVKRVPRELLEELAGSVLKATKDPACEIFKFYMDSPLIEGLKNQATVPLRTRSEVDADIAKAVRSYVEQWPQCRTLDGYYEFGSNRSVNLNLLLKQLAAEETSD